MESDFIKFLVSGVIKGVMTINGKPKVERTFRHIMGYVEQFDSLAPRDTAREVCCTALIRIAWIAYHFGVGD
jgi:hypothetical protein